VLVAKQIVNIWYFFSVNTPSGSMSTVGLYERGLVWPLIKAHPYRVFRSAIWLLDEETITHRSARYRRISSWSIKHKYDVVIIGSGVAGALCAWKFIAIRKLPGF